MAIWLENPSASMTTSNTIDITSSSWVDYSNDACQRIAQDAFEEEKEPILEEKEKSYENRRPADERAHCVRGTSVPRAHRARDGLPDVQPVAEAGRP